MLESQATAAGQAATAGTDVLPMLRKAVELKPDYVEARLRLGLLLASRENYAEALNQLHEIKKVNPEQAPSYFLALAYSDYRTGHLDDARKNAEAAKKWAKTPEQTEQAASLLGTFDTASAAPVQAVTVPATPPAGLAAPSGGGDQDSDKPTLRRRPAPASEVHEIAPRNPFVKQGDEMSHVEGLAQRLDCDGASARFQVLVGRATMVFEIPDPSKVLIKHSDEAHHDFNCGVQKPFHVAVDYAVRPDPKKGTAGIVRELDF
jgi:tetratricopeptide (TPR) repeat protein